MSNQNQSELPDLPESSDSSWGDAEKIVSSPVPLKICETHTRDKWMEHQGYVSNPDGTISCIHCPWGTPVPGYLKVSNEKIIDLRILSGAQTSVEETV